MNLKEKIKRIQELRRSNAATPVRNKKNIIEKENIKINLINRKLARISAESGVSLRV